MIEVQHVSKRFGDFLAVEDVSFSVPKGEILGFLGPNGAGKTTTMRIITGFMPPSSGAVTVAGYDIFSQSLEARKHIGYLPETVPLYTDMSVRAYLDYQASLHALRNPRRRDRVEDVIGRLRLEEYADTLIGKLSKGYRQRVGIAQAIIHEPDVLVLDEPTIGIDPIQVVETRQLIKELGQDHTIILSSHILPEVNMVCQRVVIINEGQVVAMDTPENLSSLLGGPERVRLLVRGPSREVSAVLKDVGGVSYRRSRTHRRAGRLPLPSGVPPRPGRPPPVGCGGHPAQMGSAGDAGHWHEPGGRLPPPDHSRGSPRGCGNALTIAAKEIKTYFASPMAYIIAAVFLALSGFFFAQDLNIFQLARMEGFFGPASFVVLLLAPLLTMRLLAEEQKLGSLELLLTAPIREEEIVLGKYLSSLFIFVIMLAMTLYYPLVLVMFADRT